MKTPTHRIVSAASLGLNDDDDDEEEEEDERRQKDNAALVRLSVGHSDCSTLFDE